MARSTSHVPWWTSHYDDEELDDLPESWSIPHKGAGPTQPAAKVAASSGWHLSGPQMKPLLGSPFMTPAPYIVGPMPREHRGMAACAIYLIPKELMRPLAPSCTKPLMTISSEVCFTDHADFYSISGCGAEHLRFGDIRMHTSWLPVEEASPAWEPAQVDSDAVAFVGGQSSDSVLDGTLQQGEDDSVLQDNAAWLRFQAECEKRYTILASTELAQVQSKAVAAVGGYSSGSPDLEAAEYAAPACGAAAEAEAAARQSVPEPEEAAGDAVAAAELHARDSTAEDILLSGSSAAAAEPTADQEEPVEAAESAAASKLHLVLGGLSRTLAAAASTESGEEDEASLVEAVTAEADIAQDISSELASDMHSAASMLDEQSYYSATSSLAPSTAASEAGDDASMDDLHLIGADDSSEHSMPSMLTAQSAYSGMASPAYRAAASEVISSQQSASMGDAHLVPGDSSASSAAAGGNTFEEEEEEASLEEADMAEEDAAQEGSAHLAPDVHSRPSSMTATIIKAGCLAGAALEVALEAPAAVSHCLLGQPKPADGGPAVRLYRQATTSAYVAAGRMVGLADAAFAATGAFARFLF